MHNEKKYPKRKSPRANFHNYSGGCYFVTICTQDKRHYFGNIIEGEMHLSKIGEYCKSEIEALPKHYQYSEVPLYVIMPNHLHMIICINERTHEPCVPTKRTALSVVIGRFKRALTVYARRNNMEFEWQSRYHDHIIRGDKDANIIADYIENNVARWDSDCFYL